MSRVKPPVKRSSTSINGRESDRIEEDLRRMIVAMELSPGAVVSEAFLTEKLKCGRTPLREAIQRLAQDDLVVSVPRRGISIAGLSVVDMTQLFEALVLVEGSLARLATKRITDLDIAWLEGNIAKAEKFSRAGDFSMVAELDFEFHSVIAQATGNRYLARTGTHLHRLVARFGYIGWKREGSAEASIADHRRILEAIKSHDPDSAERLQNEHTQRAKERVTSAL